MPRGSIRIWATTTAEAQGRKRVEPDVWLQGLTLPCPTRAREPHAGIVSAVSFPHNTKRAGRTPRPAPGGRTPGSDGDTR